MLFVAGLAVGTIPLILTSRLRKTAACPRKFTTATILACGILALSFLD